MADLHRLHWRIWIDWNDNGTWAETSGAYREDITADVLDLDWRWGQPVDVSANPRRPRPAQLRLTLGNEDRRYTPGNARSPLAGNLAAGRRVWAAFAWPYDGFAGADDADLNGRAVPLGDVVWDKISTGPAGIALSQGRAVATTGTGGAVYALDFGDADVHLGLVFRRSGNGSSGVALRVANQWDYLRVSFGNTATLLQDVTFGFPSFIRRGDPLVAGRDYFIEIEMHGSSVHLYATDLTGGDMDRKEILDGGGTAGNAAATKHGIWHDGSAAATGDRWDDFGGWRSFFHGDLVRISPNGTRTWARSAASTPRTTCGCWSGGPCTTCSTSVSCRRPPSPTAFSPGPASIPTTATWTRGRPWWLRHPAPCGASPPPRPFPTWPRRRTAAFTSTDGATSAWNPPTTANQGPTPRPAPPCATRRPPAHTSPRWSGTRAVRGWKTP